MHAQVKPEDSMHANFSDDEFGESILSQASAEKRRAHGYTYIPKFEKACMKNILASIPS